MKWVSDIESEGGEATALTLDSVAVSDNIMGMGPGKRGVAGALCVLVVWTGAVGQASVNECEPS